MECGPGSVTGCSAVNNDLVVYVCVCVLHRNVVTSGNIPPRAAERKGGGGGRLDLQQPDQSVSRVRSETNSLSHFYEALPEENHYWLRELAVGRTSTK